MSYRIASVEPPLDSEECQKELLQASQLIIGIQANLDEVRSAPSSYDLPLLLAKANFLAAIGRSGVPSIGRAPIFGVQSTENANAAWSAFWRLADALHACQHPSPGCRHYDLG